MTISSRTPEGDPNQCPICGHHLRLEPSIDMRDAPCPNCGHLLWFRTERKVQAIPAEGGSPLADKVIRESRSRLSEGLISIMESRLGPPTKGVRDVLTPLLADRLFEVGVVELVEADTWDEVLSMVEAAGR